MTDPAPRPKDKPALTRNGKGKFDRSPTTAKRDAQAARLRASSLTYAQIGEQLGISGPAAFEAVQRALKETLAEPAESVRSFELEKLDRAERAVWDVLDAEHVTVSQGRIVYTDEGETLRDHDPVLRAVAALISIQGRRAKLLGLDAVQKVDLSGAISYQVVGVDPEQMA